MALANDDPSNASGRITLRAAGDVWFTIRDAGADKLVIAELLAKGETYMVPNKSSLWMLIGNAAMMEIAVDGRPIPPLGAQGVIVRDVKLDPEALLNGTAMQ